MLATPGRLDHVGISVTAFPYGYALMDGGVPKRVMKVGWIAPARLGSDPSWPASVFAGTEQWIDFERLQVQYPAPGPYADRIRYHVEPGGSINIYVNQVVVPSVPNSSLMPWDRASVAWSKTDYRRVAGPTSTTVWTYTVPTGKLLYVAHAEVFLHCVNAGTGAGTSLIDLYRGSDVILDCSTEPAVAGFRDHASLDPDGMVLLPGETLLAYLSLGDTGGVYRAHASASGLLFAV